MAGSSAYFGVEAHRKIGWRLEPTTLNERLAKAALAMALLPIRINGIDYQLSRLTVASAL